ncbi:MAG: SGNH/GDSL hydrolase family protein [Verrucomicrobia bacterium]|nr:SGNH/GDSL hydrolase family protein [Verrucomicrobiota bacterium]
MRRCNRVVLVRIPAGRSNPESPEASNEADVTARDFGLPLVDLLRLSRKEGLSMTYTDGLHLTPASARAISGLLARTLQAEGFLAARP